MTETFINTSETSEMNSRDWSNGGASLPKKTFAYSKATLIAWGILIVVILITVFLYSRVLILEGERSDIISAIATDQAAIDQLKAKPELRAAELFRNNKTMLSTTIDKSNAATYIRELERIQSEDNNLIMSGFSFNSSAKWGKITTSAVSLKGSTDDAVKRIILLIRGYRDPKLANSASGALAKFDLKQIQSIAGKSDKRSINLEFTVQ